MELAEAIAKLRAVADDGSGGFVESGPVRLILAELDRLRAEREHCARWHVDITTTHDEHLAELGRLREIALEVERMRLVIREYADNVASGEKFDALLRIVPGLVSDDGTYGTPAGEGRNEMPATGEQL